ncbi:hypothetical protein BX600DRAFT_505938 [Xylariales sp. PMI_506]|nr:hypothetical protein BX600DRAFT_505938 [Xylariales sp. PMI_506]
MPQFIRRFGRRRNPIETAASTRPEPPEGEPPSYEESQTGTLHSTIAVAARFASRVAFPDFFPPRIDGYGSPPVPLLVGKEDERIIISSSSGSGSGSDNDDDDDALLYSVLEALGSAQTCGDGLNFLDRIREYMSSATSVDARRWSEMEVALRRLNDPPMTSVKADIEKNSSSSSSSSSSDGGNRSSAPLTLEALLLVLSARVLQSYYAETVRYHGPDGQRKLRLLEMGACSEPGCGCFDFDLAPPSPSSSSSSSSSSPRCYCGHPPSVHGCAAPPPLPKTMTPGYASLSLSSSSPSSSTARRRALESLLRRYVNWEPAAYARLRHRGPDGRSKNNLKQVARCTARYFTGGDTGPCCGCYDYDSRRGGDSRDRGAGVAVASRACKCGHGAEVHLALAQPLSSGKEGSEHNSRAGDGVGQMAAALLLGKKQQPTADHDEKGKGCQSEGVIPGRDGNAGAEHCDLSWMLIEAAFLEFANARKYINDLG